ncbi:hypothetical protein EIP86_002998 [Pleurotus ostreatoroseus]|nr:hypothetical protein EIP86_002998 [Pleurotus ostreatoroseus]
MNWSLAQCPQELVDTLLAQATDPNCASPLDVDQVLFVTKHLQIRGFFSSAFVLWTRNLELCRLQGKHHTLDCEGDEPYRIRYDKIRLALRKGWTRKNGSKGIKTSGRNYRIFNAPKESEINMHYHLRRWRRWLEAVLLRRSLGPDDHLFPTVSVNGQVQITVHINNTVVQGWLNEASLGADIKVQYTTHSFRRSGAQYRFMWCPFGKRWSLSLVRWWGGWAEGEHSDTLVKYLVDVLDRQEHSYENALYPIQADMEKSFMREHVDVAPASSAEVREAVGTVMREVEEFKTAIQPWAAMILSMCQQTYLFPPQALFAPTAGHLPQPSGQFPMQAPVPLDVHGSPLQYPNAHPVLTAYPHIDMQGTPVSPQPSASEAPSSNITHHAGPSESPVASSSEINSGRGAVVSPPIVLSNPTIPLSTMPFGPPISPHLAASFASTMQFAPLHI